MRLDEMKDNCIHRNKSTAKGFGKTIKPLEEVVSICVPKPFNVRNVINASCNALNLPYMF